MMIMKISEHADVLAQSEEYGSDRRCAQQTWNDGVQQILNDDRGITDRKLQRGGDADVVGDHGAGDRQTDDAEAYR